MGFSSRPPVVATVPGQMLLSLIQKKLYCLLVVVGGRRGGVFVFVFVFVVAAVVAACFLSVYHAPLYVLFL